MFLAAPQITWIRVEKPSFDLAGILISSITFSLILIGIALLLGGGLGFLFIRRHKHVLDDADAPPPVVRLGLDSH
jgi:LPXTG-motif cell wall-anchored protein